MSHYGEITATAAGGARPATRALRSQAVERVVAVMRERLDEPLPLETMAEVATLSLYHFARVFHTVTGTSPARFLSALRVAEAKRLLRTTSLSVTDVCYRVGYNSLGSFTARFTQSVGVSPGRFRRLQQGNQRYAVAPRQRREPGEAGRIAGRLPAEAGRIAGRVRAGVSIADPVFVGLFPTPVPEGHPVCCTVLSGPGEYEIVDVPDGCYYVLGACFPGSRDGWAPLLPGDGSEYVGMVPQPVRVGRGTALRGLDMWLRPVQPTDPPILAALPVPSLPSAQAARR
jgi:AraC family transcriptional regulator